MAKAKDWTKIYKKYKGQWVALASDEETVVGFGKTLKDALNKAKRGGHTDPIMTRMPNNLSPFVGAHEVSLHTLSKKHS